MEGNKTSLICITTNDDDSDKPLQVLWYNSSGAQIMSDESRISVYNIPNKVTGQLKSVMLFDPVNHTDTGVYICKAFNDPNCYTQANTSLTVECKLHNYNYVLDHGKNFM